MRLAQVGLGFGVGPPGFRSNSAPGEVRVLLFLRQKRQTAIATAIPGEDGINQFHKKTPLQQQTEEE